MKLFEWENNYTIVNNTFNFEIISPIRVNLKFIDHFQNLRLPERYNTKDNIYQYFQNIGSDILFYYMSGAVKLHNRFWVAGKIEGSEEWPVFVCAIDRITARQIDVAVITIMVKFGDSLMDLSYRRMRKYIATRSNVTTGFDNPMQQIIISEPYASENQFDGVYERGNMMDGFYKLNVECHLSDLYSQREIEVFGNQRGKSSIGALKKAQTDIINSIIYGKIEPGQQFKIKSGTSNPFYFVFKYEGVHFKRKSLMFTALTVLNTDSGVISSIPLISKIDTEENFVSSRQIVQNRKDAIQKIGADVLDNVPKLERGQDFKIDNKFRDIELQRRKPKETSEPSETIKLTESDLRKIIRNVLLEQYK